MAEHDIDPDQASPGSAAGGPTGPTSLRRGSDTDPSVMTGSRISTSLGVVVQDREPIAAAALVAEMQDALPTGSRQEFLVLDDHTNPARRDLIAALEGVGDAMRLVPRPPGGRASELDAVSLSARSEFLVLALGVDPPLSCLEPALSTLWTRGADALTILAPGAARPPADVGSRLAEHLGLSSSGPAGAPGPRVVVIRRWVARWLFSETDRALDVADEVADRARLLGLDLLVVDS